MNNYELMVIFTPVLSEEEFKSIQKKYTDYITGHGGSITLVTQHLDLQTLIEVGWPCVL